MARSYLDKKASYNFAVIEGFWQVRRLYDQNPESAIEMKRGSVVKGEWKAEGVDILMLPRNNIDSIGFHIMPEEYGKKERLVLANFTPFLMIFAEHGRAIPATFR